MAVELQFSKSGNSPWGFRLTGGAECEVPLTVIKVAENSIAAKTGLQPHDVIIRINNQPAAGLTHAEAHEILLAIGDEFSLTVLRGEGTNDLQDDEQSNQEVSSIMQGTLQTGLSTSLEYMHKETAYFSEKKVARNGLDLAATDEQIAEAISGETEVLPQQNVLGVNFNKVDLAGSTVLKAVNEEETKIDLLNKKWSTFLQKPKTSVIVPKKKGPDGPPVEPYRVIIKKQKKKSTDNPEEPSQISSHDITTENFEVQEENIEETEKVEVLSEEEIEEFVSTDVEEKIINREESDLEEETGDNLEERITETVTETSVSLEDQLARVQQQLEALAQLPSAIQVTLDAVTQQLAKIVQATHKKEEKFVSFQETTEDQSVTSEDETTEQITDGETSEFTATKFEVSSEYSDVEERIKHESLEYLEILDDEEEKHNEAVENLDNESERHLKEEVEEEIKKFEEEKAAHHERMEEFHQRRLEQRPTHPLTPLQRPIVLPGGRRWAQPGDAVPTPRKSKMTDEKICETLETYSEIITGRTKGINFLKYQPPPRNLDYLQRSEVFKLIHDEDPPKRGIAARPGKIPSVQDYCRETRYQQAAVEI